MQVPSQPLCTSETPCCKITLRNSRPCAAVKDGRFYDSSPRRRGPELQEAHTPSEAVSPAQGEPRAGLERRSRGARALGQVLFIYLKQMALTSLTKSFVLFVHRNEIKKKKKQKHILSAVRNYYSSIKKHTKFLFWRKAAAQL